MMELYLMQHGEARSKEEDPDRPLTDAGKANVERVAQRVGFAVAWVLTPDLAARRLYPEGAAPIEQE